MMSKAKNKYNNHIYVFSDFEELTKIRKFVTTHAVDFGFSEDEAQKIALAVDEACTNLIQHSFKYDRGRQFSIQIETGVNMFTVNILDDGKPFNPLDAKTPNLKKYLREYKRGGLGIPIMKKVMDEISYTPSGDSNSRNILKLKKVLP